MKRASSWKKMLRIAPAEGGGPRPAYELIQIRNTATDQGRAKQSVLPLTCPVHWRQLSACVIRGLQLQTAGFVFRGHGRVERSESPENEPAPGARIRNLVLVCVALGVVAARESCERAVLLGQVRAVPVEMQSAMSASGPGHWRAVAELSRWGRWRRWASTGKGDVASVSAQRGLPGPPTASHCCPPAWPSLSIHLGRVCNW